MLWSIQLLKPYSKSLTKIWLEDGKFLRNVIKNSLNKAKGPVTDIKRQIIQNNPKNSILLFKFKNSSLTRLSVLTGLSGCAVLKCSLANTVHCKTSQRVIDKPASSNFDWKKFFELIWPDMWSLVGAILAALAAAVMNIQLPIYLGEIINVMTRFIGNESRNGFSSQMQGPVFSIMGLYVAQSVATFLYIYLLSNAGERLATRMKCLLYSSILRQDLEFFDKKRTGDLVDCITSDVQEFKSAFKSVVAQGLRSSTQIAGCIVSMYVLSPSLTMGMLVVVSTVIVGGTMIGTLLRGISRVAQQHATQVTTLSEETLSNVRTVRAFANEQLELEKFTQQVQETQTLYQRLGLGIALFQAGTNMFLNGLVLSTLYMGGYLVATNELNAGNLMSFLVATQTIQRSLAQLSLLFGSYVRGMQAGSRVFEFINTEEKIPLNGGKIIPFHSLVADIEFENVTFTYPTRPHQVILKDFNLKLPAGKTVAIVGTSGNGKSTIAALLERFYDVDGGCIRLGGEDIRDLDPCWLRGKTIGLINQEPILFATTIMENIRYGKPDATDQEVIEAAKLANADKFTRQFPEGYQTVLGERGVTVSGGQKQRIAIARALLKNPSVLILDEATSALDTESEKVVQQALLEVCRYRTVLVIAHRLSTIKHADIIVVLSAGQIVENAISSWRDHQLSVASLMAAVPKQSLVEEWESARKVVGEERNEALLPDLRYVRQ